MNDIIRIGVVSALNNGNRTVRVRFPSENMVSGWLKVVKSPPAVTVQANTAADTSVKGDEEEDIELSADTNIKVNVAAKTLPWFPLVGDTVLCIYNPGFNEDGFVIGGL